MAVHVQPSFILSEKFERLKFGEYGSTDSMSSTPSTPSTPFTPPADPFEIEIIKAEDKEEVLEFLRKFFISDEPLNVCINLLDEDNPRCYELEEFSTKDLDSGLNLKAVSSGKIIGVCLNGDIERGYIDGEPDIDCPNKKFKKILTFLDHVARQSDIFSQFPDVDKAITVKILSVDKMWRGRGIAKDLMDRTREMAIDMGYKLMTTDCSSHFTARAIRKLGFNCIYKLPYEDYKVDGEVVFKPAHPHTEVTVYAKRLDQ